MWQDGSSEPIQVFPYRAGLLPLEDQKALTRGIRVDSKEDLAQLLEDYLS
ncbi:MAG: BofC C-terminal domain-containing protein [Oscillospiraceae bacterium]|nr:BofC C-terminal domain-containing protein [Oscillospiraceae bacterium]